MSLRGLDDRIVPRLATALQRVVDRGKRLVERAPAAPPELEPEPKREPGPAPAILRLRRVDDRYAGSGVLRIFREVPQLGALFVAILVLVAGATAFTRNSRESSDPGSDPTATESPDVVVEPPDDNRVGPALGEDVPTYLATVLADLRRRSEDDPDSLAWTVISFDRYFTPREAALLLREPTPQYVLFRVPPGRGGQSEPVQARVTTNVEKDALAAFAAAAREKRVQANEFDELARTSVGDPAFQAEYEAQAARARAEAAELAKGCRCIFGVVVKSRASALMPVALQKGVRAVDMGPAGAPFGQLQFRGLLPEERVTVTGGNEGSPGGNG